MKKLNEIIGAFSREEDGVALTEYLILLALLIGGVILTVQIAGQSLNAAWLSWSSFWNVMPAPVVVIP